MNHTVVPLLRRVLLPYIAYEHYRSIIA